MEEGGGSESGGYLPPEPGGPEPDLGSRPAHGEPGPGPPPGSQQPPPVPQQQPPGWQPPPPGWQPPPPGWQPPHAWQQQPAWQQQAPASPPPPAQPAPYGWQPQPYAWQPQPPVPDNGSAVAGFVLSLVAGTLLVLSAGLSSIVSAVCAGLGIFYSLRGRRKVDRGETPKHRGLAQAGFIVGILSLALAILATVGWVLLFALGDFEDFEELNDPDGFETSVRVGAGLLGMLLR